MSDLISRQYTIEEIARHDCTNGEIPYFTGKGVQEILRIIPSAQQWTSVTCPPKEFGWYLTQTVRGVIDKKYYGVHKEKDKSLIGWGDTDMGEYPHYSHHHPKNKVVAWMPLPEPYKESE